MPYNPQVSSTHLVGTTVQRTTGVDGAQSVIVDTSAYRPADREVRLTIIEIIRQHLSDPGTPGTWCGYDLDFTGANFDGGNFSQAHFTGGTVTFDQAVFSGGRVSFDRATFSGAGRARWQTVPGLACS